MINSVNHYCQAMGEVALDEKMAKVDDELETRLARLRGEEAQARGAIARPPAAFPLSHNARADDTLGEDLDDMSMDEVSHAL